MIKAENVTKSFEGFKALDDLTLTVRKGSVYGLIGPNGAERTGCDQYRWSRYDYR